MSSSKASPVSPLAPLHVPELPPIRGVRLATAEAGIRYAGRTDVLYVGLDAGTRAAGVFTRSRCPSAPVDWCREALKDGGGFAFPGHTEYLAHLAGGAEVAMMLASTTVDPPCRVVPATIHMALEDVPAALTPDLLDRTKAPFEQVIKDAGYPLITPVLVTNTPKYASVEGRPADAVTPGDAVITVTTK